MPVENLKEGRKMNSNIRYVFICEIIKTLDLNTCHFIDADRLFGIRTYIRLRQC